MTEFQASGDSDDEVGGDSDSEDEGSGGGGDGSGSKDEGSGGGGDGSGSKDEGSGGDGEGSGSEGGAGDNGSQQGDSSGEMAEISCHESEESGSENSGSSSESKVDVKKACPSKKTAKSDPKTTLLKLDSKDSEEEHKTKCHGFACHSDVNFSMWQDEQISQGPKQWDKMDKMTCDHAEPGKEAKCPDPLGTLLDYMESHRVFKIGKMSEYDLCHFHQVGLSGDFPKFPAPCEPTTNDHLHHFLENAGECSWPNLRHTHGTQSQWFACSKNSTPKPAFDALRWRLMLRLVKVKEEAIILPILPILGQE